MLSSNDPVISQVGCAAARPGAASLGGGATAGRGGARAGLTGAAASRLRSRYMPILIPAARRRSGTIPYRVTALRRLFPDLRPAAFLKEVSGMEGMTVAAA